MKAKKLIALLIAVVMVISMLPIFASASPDNSYSNIVPEEAEALIPEIIKEDELIPEEPISEPEEECYYLYHSSNGDVETVNIEDTDITDNVNSGYLYGGYYTDKSYSIAYTECGMSMTPVAGRTYYLKEISRSYARPELCVTYADKSKTVSGMYVITAMDSNRYADVGFIIENGSEAGRHSVGKLAETVTVYKNANTDVYSARDFFSGLSSTDVLSVKQLSGESNGVKVTAYYTTPDKVCVTGGVQGTITRSGSSHNYKFNTSSVEPSVQTVGSFGFFTYLPLYATAVLNEGTVNYMNYTPVDPEFPDVPDVPDKPDTPDKPDVPDKPDTPDNPDVPDKPDGPDKPDVPDKPDIPDKPGEPIGPEKPEPPKIPEKQDKPAETDTPTGNTVVNHRTRTNSIYNYGSTAVPGFELPEATGTEELKEVEITMNINGETVTVKGSEGYLAQQLEIPEAEDSLFAGWYTDEELTVPADLDSIDENTSLYAKFISDNDISVGVSRAKLFRPIYKSSIKLPGDSFISCSFICTVGDDEIHVYTEKVKPSIFDWSKDDIDKYAGEWSVSMHTGDELTVTPCFKTADGSTVYGDPVTYVYCLGFFI